jgi:hypothetical protein
MIAPQPPPLPILIPGQAVADTDMPSQRLAAIAAVKTRHIVVANRLPYRDSRSQNLWWLNLLPKLTECLMY